jgi:hypothetical protein
MAAERRLAPRRLTSAGVEVIDEIGGGTRSAAPKVRLLASDAELQAGIHEARRPALMSFGCFIYGRWARSGLDKGTRSTAPAADIEELSSNLGDDV